MIDILLYSQCVSSKTDDSRMDKALVNVLKPIMKIIYQDKSFDKTHLFLTVEEIRYLEEMYPELNVFITSLVKQKLITMLTGTYHNIDPVFFPQKIIAEDIEKMTTLLRRSYTRRPTEFFPYASIWSEGMFTALYNSGFSDVYFQPVKNIKNFPKSTFEIHHMQKSLRIHHADETIDGFIGGYLDGTLSESTALDSIKTHIIKCNDEVLVGINLDDFALKDGSFVFVEKLMYALKSLQNDAKTPSEDREVTDADNIDDLNKSEEIKPLERYFMPQGCYSDLSQNLNLQGDILRDDNLSFTSRVEYISDIILDNNKKKAIADRNYLEGLMCSLSSAAIVFEKYRCNEYLQKRRRDFYEIVQLFSTTPLIKREYNLHNRLINVIISKSFFALENKCTLYELGIMATGHNPLENGYAFKDGFIKEGVDTVEYAEYKNEELDKKTTMDIRSSSLFNYGEITKELHVKSSSVVMNISLKNTNKKNFAYTYVPSFLFSGVTCDEKRNDAEVQSVKFKIENSSDTLTILFSKPLLFKENMLERKDGYISFTPKYDLKLKKDEGFDLIITLRYDKGQEGKNDNRESKKV